MGKQKAGSDAVQQHATELVDYDVTFANGEHRIAHGLAAVNAALSSGGVYAVEVGIREGVYADERSWTEALQQQYRADAAHGGGR